MSAAGFGTLFLIGLVLHVVFGVSKKRAKHVDNYDASWYDR